MTRSYPGDRRHQVVTPRAQRVDNLRVEPLLEIHAPVGGCRIDPEARAVDSLLRGQARAERLEDLQVPLRLHESAHDPERAAKRIVGGARRQAGNDGVVPTFPRRERVRMAALERKGTRGSAA